MMAAPTQNIGHFRLRNPCVVVFTPFDCFLYATNDAMIRYHKRYRVTIDETKP